LLEELRESGFIQAYVPYGRSAKDTVYKLIDEYSLFYVKYMANGKLQGPGSWARFSAGQSWLSWCGISFENICLKHIDQIKQGLGIAGVHTEHYVWRHTPKGQEQGAQIDLLIDRQDHSINICEMKFSKSEFEITKRYAEELQNKIDVFQSISKTNKSLFLTLVTTHGLKNRNSFLDLVQQEITMDVLFNTKK
jgi:hypothetical protein